MVPEDADSYWDQESHEATPADAYFWPKDKPAAVRESNPNYWNEATHNRPNDADWQAGRNDSTDYWPEVAHARTTADAYWTLTAM